MRRLVPGPNTAIDLPPTWSANLSGKIIFHRGDAGRAEDLGTEVCSGFQVSGKTNMFPWILIMLDLG
jgi:hypothetical protein